jgi:hypothetical protein
MMPSSIRPDGAFKYEAVWLLLCSFFYFEVFKEDLNKFFVRVLLTLVSKLAIKWKVRSE